jgi:hypothetical protein
MIDTKYTAMSLMKLEHWDFREFRKGGNSLLVQKGRGRKC